MTAESARLSVVALVGGLRVFWVLLSGRSYSPVRIRLHTACLVLAVSLLQAFPVAAEVYAYVNEHGDYVVSQKRPGKGVEYAILTDDGEFVRLVQPRDMDVPVTHWRPWFIPKEPDPYDFDPEALEEREGVIEIEEVDRIGSPDEVEPER